MIFKPTEITKTQKREVVKKLFEESTASFDFFLMFILSALIVGLGLLMSSIAIIIGGMLVAPILFPILSFAMGIVVGDLKLMRRSGLTILQSILMVALISFVVSLLFIGREMTPEIITRTSPNLAFFLIALFSGAAAAYAMSRPSLSEVLPGVAISVSLIPPLSVIGIAISFSDWSMAVGALGLFFLNLIGIIFASVCVFAVLRFYEVKEVIEQKIEAEEKIVEKEKKEKEKEKVEEIEKRIIEAAEIIKENKKSDE